MVECAGLEIRYTVLRIEGSNPSFSANHKGLMLQKMYFRPFSLWVSGSFLPNPAYGNR